MPAPLDGARRLWPDGAMAAPAPLFPPGEDVIVALAEQALAAIPTRLARHLDGVAILVEDMPDEATLREMELEAGWDLTGLYRGTPLGQKSVDDLARPPDTILLYRLPILLEWIETEVDLAALVRNVVVHEIAHHFGFSDAEIAALEAEME